MITSEHDVCRQKTWAVPRLNPESRNTSRTAVVISVVPRPEVGTESVCWWNRTGGREETGKEGGGVVMPDILVTARRHHKQMTIDRDSQPHLLSR